ncbi:MAG: twin-arginine translocase TatA/TatE family subunit [Sphingomonadales bacterium]|nr:twin-arginine translocase TatA/TatE family subunit [Sphingomonadales bacterium]MDE2567616.1 twin-arginine translocase TatA/TatE family subunit [Sphingomonadales bacterium]
MGGLSVFHWIIVALVVLVLFGRGRISEVMGDFGKGIKSFKQGLNEDDSRPVPPQPPVQIAPPPAQPVSPPPAAAPQPTVNGEPVSHDNQTGVN